MNLDVSWPKEINSRLGKLLGLLSSLTLQKKYCVREYTLSP